MENPMHSARALTDEQAAGVDGELGDVFPSARASKFKIDNPMHTERGQLPSTVPRVSALAAPPERAQRVSNLV